MASPTGAKPWIADGEPEELEPIVGRVSRDDGGYVSLSCLLCGRIRPGRLVNLTEAGLALASRGCYGADMKPTIGRIVHYHPCVCRDASDLDTGPIPLVTYAALVVGAHSDGTPILRVFPDSGDSYTVDCGLNGYSVDGVTRTDEPTMGHWNWPPRE